MMPYYKPIKNITPTAVRRRTIAGLQSLRKQLDYEMPNKSKSSTLVLGTWNIRNFDDNRFCNGSRTNEDLHYIAEIISRFDVIAIQEICDDLTPLDKVMRLLGYDYDYIVTDVTEGRGGNGERLGFIFDRTKVKFKGEAGELVLPDNLQIIDGEKKRQFSRTPFMCSFQCGWFKFMFSTVHIYFGKSSGAKYERRVSEIESVARFLAKRAKAADKNHILVGDFNIMKPGSRGFNALEEEGFEIYQNDKGSNREQNKFYDQISFCTREDELKWAQSGRAKGVLNFLESIYRESDFEDYLPDLEQAIHEKIERIEGEIEEKQEKRKRTESENQKKKLSVSIKKAKASIKKWEETLEDQEALEDYYLREWRTFHGSDHFPLWVELRIDFSTEYLEYLATL